MTTPKSCTIIIGSIILNLVPITLVFPFTFVFGASLSILILLLVMSLLVVSAVFLVPVFRTVLILALVLAVSFVFVPALVAVLVIFNVRAVCVPIPLCVVGRARGLRFGCLKGKVSSLLSFWWEIKVRIFRAWPRPS